MEKLYIAYTCELHGAKEVIGVFDDKQKAADAVAKTLRLHEELGVYLNHGGMVREVNLNENDYAIGLCALLGVNA